MHQAITPAEGVPETGFFGVTPAVQRIPIVRLPSMTPMQGLKSPVRHLVAVGKQHMYRLHMKRVAIRQSTALCVWTPAGRRGDEVY